MKMDFCAALRFSLPLLITLAAVCVDTLTAVVISIELI